jgi:hypothetical protein
MDEGYRIVQAEQRAREAINVLRRWSIPAVTGSRRC